IIFFLSLVMPISFLLSNFKRNFLLFLFIYKNPNWVLVFPPINSVCLFFPVHIMQMIYFKFYPKF
ncbi:hypothetical protein L9F63_005137, partial [Diploptera punctata]